MKDTIKSILCLLLIVPVVVFSKSEDPWFSGPLFENHPVTMPKNKGFFDFSTVSQSNNGFYDIEGNVISAPRTSINNYSIDFAYGLSDNTDFRLYIPYIRNLVSGKSYSRIGDVTLTVGYQVFRQKNSKWLPDLRLTIDETFPTGAWDNLNPNNNGADATGTGSYQTALGIRVRKMIALPSEHFLVLHSRIVLTQPSFVSISHYSIYGGSRTSKGRLMPGNSALVDFATEYNFTRNWGGVFEFSIMSQGASTFSGKLSDRGEDGVLPRFIFSDRSQSHNARRARRRDLAHIIFNTLMPSQLNLGKDFIGNGNNLNFVLSPAIEYNFSSGFGIVGGPAFNPIGRNFPVFMSAVVTIYKNWEA